MEETAATVDMLFLKATSRFVCSITLHILASSKVKDLAQVQAIIKAQSGEQGGNKCCHGKNAGHVVVEVSAFRVFFVVSIWAHSVTNSSPKILIHFLFLASSMHNN